MECQPGDQPLGLLAEQIESMCRQRGLQPSPNGKNGTYHYSVVRHYEPPDLFAAPFLMLGTQKRLLRDAESIGRDASGRLQLPATQAKPSIKLASVFLSSSCVVSNAMWKVLRSEDFVGLQWVETVVQGKSIHAASEPFWEICSRLTLPRMANSVRIEHSPTLCFSIQEPPYRYGEPHYRQRDVSSLGIFDVAWTWEPMPGGRRLVVSQRFYQHCLKHKMPLEVEPVRIDPD